MKYVSKILLIGLIMILFFSLTLGAFNSVNAEYNWETEIENIEKAESGEELTPIKNLAGTFLVITKIICIGIAVVMLIVLAMKYMVSAPGDRATVKKHAVVYVVGAVILFAASGILQIIQKFAEGNLGKTTK